MFPLSQPQSLVRARMIGRAAAVLCKRVFAACYFGIGVAPARRDDAVSHYDALN